MSFKSYNLGDIYDFSSGLSKSRSEFGFGYPFVTFKDVFYNYFIPSKLSELANTTVKEREKCSVKRGDVFLTRTSETLHELGQSSVALKDYPDATFNGFTKRLRPNRKVEIYPEYIGYYFRSPNFRAEVTSMAVMTTRASLNNEIMSKLRVKLPSLEEQRAIANILKSLDDKIEVNNKINQKLEEMAQAIFKQWFIDFDFPNKEGKPYKSSGGEMVESEIGMIPKGWNKYTIGDYCKVRSGYAFKSKWWSDEGVGVIKIKDIEEKTIDLTQLSKVNQEYTNKATEFEVVSGDLLIAMTGATVGKFGLVPKSKEKLFVNQRVGKFFLGEDPLKKLPFIFCSLNQSHVNSSIINIAQGSAQPNISASEIESIFTVNTDEQTIEKFNSFIYPVFKAYVQNIYEQSKLTKLRDTLLPKLMSGEIRVPIKN